jgi:hypothetical protein
MSIGFMSLHAQGAGFLYGCPARFLRIPRLVGGHKKAQRGENLRWDLFLAAAIVSHLGISNLKETGKTIFSLL